MSSDLTLAEELVLLATNERGSTESSAWASLDNGIAGARLLELSLAGRLALGEKGAIVVADERPTGDELTDEALGRIAASERRRDAKHWVSKLAGGKVRKQVLARLDDRGVLAARSAAGSSASSRAPATSRSTQAPSARCASACAARSWVTGPRTRAPWLWPGW